MANEKYKYFKSSNVHVFPCAYRGEDYDPEARINSERNLSEAVSDLAESYVKSFDSDNGVLKCVLGGYYFEITGFTLTDNKIYYGDDLMSNYPELRIRLLKNVGTDLKTTVLDSLENSDTSPQYLDKDDCFIGLAYCASDAELSYTYKLKIIDTITGLANPAAFLPRLQSGSGTSANGKRATAIMQGAEASTFTYTDISGATSTYNVDADGNYSVMLNGNSRASGYRSLAAGMQSVAGGTNSVATGYQASALGDSSHAEGVRTFATGQAAHAEGQLTIADNRAAHAEGEYTMASGVASHAEGQGSSASTPTLASGSVSHAEGICTTASGLGSHASGYKTIANATYSYAEGNTTTASGIASHAEGSGTLAGNNNAHAEGGSTKATGLSSHSEGGNTEASESYSHAEGNNTKASGAASHAEGKGLSASTLTLAYGEASHAEGVGTQANGIASHAEGNQTTVAATGIAGHAEGSSTTVSGLNAHAEGYNTTASGYGSHAENYGTTASGYSSHASGYKSVASGTYSYANGFKTQASGFAGNAGGRFTKASGEYSSAYGTGLVIGNLRAEYTAGEKTIAIDTRGLETIDIKKLNMDYFVGLYLCIIGYLDKPSKITSATLNDDVIIFTFEGFDSDYTESNEVVILTTAEAEASISAGCGNMASGTLSYAGGALSTASGVGAIANGYNAKAYGYFSAATGENTIASGTYAYATGYGTKASGFLARADGYDTVANASESTANGYMTAATSQGATAIGEFTQASNIFAFASGCGYVLGETSQAYSKSSNSIGVFLNNAAYDEYNTVNSFIGRPLCRSEHLDIDKNIYITAATLNQNVAVFTLNTVFAEDIPEGTSMCIPNVASGQESKASGQGNLASGWHANAEGYLTMATGNETHAEGYNTISEGHAAHAEGFGTKASAYYSHAEGSQTVASKDRSHAEGYKTTASGVGSHAEGDGTVASGKSAHAEGNNTIADRENLLAVGQYNANTSDGDLFVVGNGTSNNDRSTVLEVNKDYISINKKINTSVEIDGPKGAYDLTATRVLVHNISFDSSNTWGTISNAGALGYGDTDGNLQYLFDWTDANVLNSTKKDIKVYGRTVRFGNILFVTLTLYTEDLTNFVANSVSTLHLQSLFQTLLLSDIRYAYLLSKNAYGTSSSYVQMAMYNKDNELDSTGYTEKNSAGTDFLHSTIIKLYSASNNSSLNLDLIYLVKDF